MFRCLSLIFITFFASSVAAAPTIHVLSNRADLVSGGDALVEISGSMDRGSLKVRLNNKDVTDAFAQRENGRVMGLLTGLEVGANTLKVTGAGGSASTTITNHPNYGPIFSAGQHRPDGWDDCAAGRVSPQEDCNIEVTYEFFYKSTNPQPGLIAFNPEDGLPSDVAMTTTDEGITVPFVVRREYGFQDRDRYTYMVLFDPDQPWAPWQPQPQFNHKMFVTHGGNCGMSFSPDHPKLTDSGGGLPGGPEHSYITALGRGFAVMATALNNLGHNCDVVLMAESMMMAKERFIEQYGELRYTIGTGCSGGAIAQLTISNAYPGIYQGLITTCTYPDVVSPALQASDLDLMRIYFEDPSRWAPGVTWSPHQFGLVEGHITHVNAVAMDELLWTAASNTEGGCAGEDTYHPTSNPEGIRCGAIEWFAHVFGKRDAMAKTGDRKITVAKTPAGNVGIQYGLEALRGGQITTAQFVDLNVKIGGLDYDIDWQAERWSGDPEGGGASIARAVRSGAINPTTNLDRVAIINLLGPDPGAAHDSVHAYWLRWRLDRVQGHHENQVMWAGPVALFADPYYFNQALVAMDRWLTEVEADNRSRPMLNKIVENRPEDIHDQCSDGLGHKVADEVCVEFLRHAYAYGTPRTVAGADRYAMNMECQLQPLNRESDYGPVPFTDEQWAQLESVFQEGVCDYRKPGLGEEEQTVPWLSYQDGKGNVVVGGAAMPPVPEHSMGGWTAPAFSAE